MKKMTLFLFTSLLLGANVHSQVVTTFTDGTPDDAVVLDSNGNIYCSNYVGDSVFRFTPGGDVVSFVSGLNTPNGLAFNSIGELYVCDGAGNTVFKYDIDGNQLDAYPNTGHPSGIIKSHDSDTMIFTEYIGNTLNTLDPDGTITEISSDPLLVGPVGLAYDENNELYVGNYTNRKIYKVLTGGALEYIATVGGSSNLGFIAYAQGMLWGTVLGEHKIYRINPNGVDDVELFAGSSAGNMDGDISKATFNQPNGIIFNDAEDTMYVTDFGSKNLRIISGIVLGISDNEMLNADLKLYPNPAKDVITFSGKTFQNEYKIRVIDTYGKLLYHKATTTNGQKFLEAIDVSTFSAGTYLVEFIDGINTVTKKFVK